MYVLIREMQTQGIVKGTYLKDNRRLRAASPLPKSWRLAVSNLVVLRLLDQEFRQKTTTARPMSACDLSSWHASVFSGLPGEATWHRYRRAF